MELYITSRRRLSLPDNREFTPEDMPIETVLKALDVAAAGRGNRMVSVRGNEPLLYPGLEQLCASAAKRGLQLLFETTGLFTSGARQILSAHCRQIVLRVYRPEFYTAEDLSERAETVAWLAEHGCSVTRCVVVDDPAADYSFAVADDFLGGVCSPDEVIFRTSCTLSREALLPFTSWLSARRLEASSRGRMMVLDCGGTPCAFSDAALGQFARTVPDMSRCVPHNGVCPDGRTVHCWEMAGFPCRPVTHFKREEEVTQYYYQVFLGLQWQFQCHAPCLSCVSRFQDRCMGVSMASKASVIASRYESLREEFAAEESGGAVIEGASRLEKLWELGRVSVVLGRHADALECLEELRGLEPSDGRVHYMLGEVYWELGRLSDGEEEYRKASRLMDSPIPALQELHQKLVQNGNTLRARLLQGEIEKLSLRKGTPSGGE